MTTSLSNSPSEFPEDYPVPPQRLMCQTPDCGQFIRVITIDTEDGTTDSECFGCMLARNLAILKSLGDQGLLEGVVNDPERE
jgi:hypothetical protein